MKGLCVYANLPSSRPRSILRPGVAAISQSVSQLVELGGWHDRGGWPGLGARVELGDWCGSRVPDRKIRNDEEACGSQTTNRLVATTEGAFPKATVELEASLSTQAVAESRVSRVESEPRSRVEGL